MQNPIRLLKHSILNESRVKLVAHTTHSQDFAPNNFFYQYIKILRGKKRPGANAAVEELVHLRNFYLFRTDLKE